MELLGRGRQKFIKSEGAEQQLDPATQMVLQCIEVGAARLIVFAVLCCGPHQVGSHAAHRPHPSPLRHPPTAATDPNTLPALLPSAHTQAINASAEVIETTQCRVDLDRVLGIQAFNLDRVLEEEPDFLEVGGLVGWCRVGWGGVGGRPWICLFFRAKQSDAITNQL